MDDSLCNAQRECRKWIRINFPLNKWKYDTRIRESLFFGSSYVEGHRRRGIHCI